MEYDQPDNIAKASVHKYDEIVLIVDSISQVCPQRVQCGRSSSKIILLCHMLMSVSTIFCGSPMSRVLNHFTSFPLNNATQNLF